MKKLCIGDYICVETIESIHVMKTIDELERMNDKYHTIEKEMRKLGINQSIIDTAREDVIVNFEKCKNDLIEYVLNLKMA